MAGMFGLDYIKSVTSGCDTNFVLIYGNRRTTINVNSESKEYIEERIELVYKLQ
jgi:hypothetical protein